ncbi:MAG: LCP family protein [Clostridiales bacterium]|nr:LCP family protein [Clostridiales bacterium]
MENTDNYSRKQTEKQTTSRKRKHGRKKQNKTAMLIGQSLSLILMLVQLVCGMFLCLEVYQLGLLPLRYLTIIGVVVLIMAGIQIGLIVQKTKTAYVISCLLALCFSGFIALGCVYVWKTDQTMKQISDNSKETMLDEVAVAVMADSPYYSVEDLAGKVIGTQKTLDRTNTDKTLESLKEILDNNVEVQEYEGMYDMVQAFYDGSEDAIVFNEAYRPLIVDSFETFEEDIRILNTYTYTSTVPVDQEEEKVAEPVNIEEEEPFIIYLSGIDTYGDIGTKSRSDVNILATVNPTTRQILLVTTPRDYYVPLAVSGQPLDKLTHAGIYGINCSISTLENLYDIDINYYLRVNFTGFVGIVDALDGVDVVSEKSFTGEVGGHSFTAGVNHVNGEEALSFVRERHSFGEGDIQRARNQMAMIKAILNKIMSPAILTRYTSLMDSVSYAFMTDMSQSEIATLVKMQLDDGREWTINTYSTEGTGARRTTYSMGSQSLWVSLPHEDSIAQASEYMRMVKDGEILDLSK